MTHINIITLILMVFITLPGSAFGNTPAKVVTLPLGMYSSDFVPRPLNFKTGSCPDAHNIYIGHNQILAELLILCKALELGGLNPAFEFKNIPDYLRILNDSANSVTLMPGFGIWKTDINPDLFYISEPLLKEKEFVKGIYTVPGNKKLLAIKSYSELKNYMVATNQNWSHDNAEISCITSKVTTAGSNPHLMARMIVARRADFMLFPFFNSPDLHGYFNDIRLVPVKGVKVAFNESIHFIVSKKHPQGLMVYEALQKGLKELHADGTLSYIYKKIGFFNPQVKDWIELGCGYQTNSLQP
jgi:ABC-type amino acid transport substrate-binding protein